MLRAAAAQGFAEAPLVVRVRAAPAGAPGAAAGAPAARAVLLLQPRRGAHERIAAGQSSAETRALLAAAGVAVAWSRNVTLAGGSSTGGGSGGGGGGGGAPLAAETLAEVRGEVARTAAAPLAAVLVNARHVPAAQRHALAAAWGGGVPAWDRCDALLAVGRAAAKSGGGQLQLRLAEALRRKHDADEGFVWRADGSVAPGGGGGVAAAYRRQCAEHAHALAGKVALARDRSLAPALAAHARAGRPLVAVVGCLHAGKTAVVQCGGGGGIWGVGRRVNTGTHRLTVHRISLALASRPGAAGRCAARKWQPQAASARWSQACTWPGSPAASRWLCSTRRGSFRTCRARFWRPWVSSLRCRPRVFAAYYVINPTFLFSPG
jgi:hypothetical protein